MRQGRASLYRTMLIFMDKIGDNQLFERAYGVAFNFTLSIFPSIIFLFALVPFLHTMIPYVSTKDILLFLSEVMPQNLYLSAEETIKDTVSIRREGLISFGVLFALFLATNGVNSLMKAFNTSYKTTENRGFLKMRMISLVITLILAFAFIIAISLLVVGQLVIEWLFSFGVFSDDLIIYIILPIRFIVIFIFFYLAVASIYYWGPAIHDRWRFFSEGSLMATLLCVLVSFGFSVYINQFSTYNKVYGSIGTLIALMIWQYLMSAILLLGFEFNASIDRAASGKVYDLERD